MLLHEFSSHQVILDAALIDLVNRHLAEVTLRFIEDTLAMGKVELPEAIAFELILTDEVGVAMAEDGVKDPLGLDIALQVNLPDLLCYLPVEWIAGVGQRQGNHLLECVIEVFLVVVERGVAILL